MNRYKINLTDLEWGIIGMDIAKIPNPEPSTLALMEYIVQGMKLRNEHEDIELPYNVETVDANG